MGNSGQYSKLFWSLWGICFSVFGFSSLAMWGIEEGTQTLGFALYQISKSDMNESEVKIRLEQAVKIYSLLDHASSVLCSINPLLRVWAVPYMEASRFQFQIYKEILK